jgi:hypothetical protein
MMETISQTSQRHAFAAAQTMATVTGEPQSVIVYPGGRHDHCPAHLTFSELMQAPSGTLPVVTFLAQRIACTAVAC